MSKISHTDTLNLPPYGKAENLGILSTIHEINVPRFVVLRPNISEGEQTTIIQEFLRTYRKETVAVRSSASHEDSVSASFAGMYATKLHVTANLHDIQAAVEEVRASSTSKKEVVSHYTGHRSVALTDNYMSVIIQEMIDADTSGVIFSHDLSKADGYYTVSVSSGVGETIVGGNANGTLIRIARGVKPSDIRDAQIQQLVIAMKAIERQFRSSSLCSLTALWNRYDEIWDTTHWIQDCFVSWLGNPTPPCAQLRSVSVHSESPIKSTSGWCVSIEMLSRRILHFKTAWNSTCMP